MRNPLSKFETDVANLVAHVRAVSLSCGMTEESWAALCMAEAAMALYPRANLIGFEYAARAAWNYCEERIAGTEGDGDV